MKRLSAILLVFLWWIFLFQNGQILSGPAQGPFYDATRCHYQANVDNTWWTSRPFGSYYDCKFYWGEPASPPTP